MNWDESEHPRDDKGKFTKGNGTYGAAYDKIISSAREEYEKAISSPQLSKQEYGILRAEVMRKNAAQKGSVKPTDFAFTANYFYVYSTTGGDDFVPLVRLDIEKDGEEISQIISCFKER